MAVAKAAALALYSLLSFRLSDSRCYLPKLGMFDCGDGECVSADFVCDGKVDCNSTSKDETACDHHFRRVCLTDTETLLNTDSFTNFYLGYNIISGYTVPILDWRHVDARVHPADCRRADGIEPSSGSQQPLPLLPHNMANFTYTDAATLDTPEFHSAVFDNAYDAFLDLKKRKSVVVAPDMTYEKDLRAITLSDAYKTSRVPGGDFYWFDEQVFWQANAPLIRVYLEKVTGEFRVRPNDRLALNPEMVPDLSSAIEQSNQNGTGGNDLWWKFFERYGTHLPVGGTVGGWIEIIAKRKMCSKKNGTGNAHFVSMADIKSCLSAKARRDAADEKLQCGKLDRKFGVQSTADIIDWAHRKVMGGNESLLGSSDRFPSADELENWSKTVQSDATALSTNLVAICELIDRFVPDNRENTSSNETSPQGAQSSCQRALLSYVREKDVLNVPEPTMIPCRRDAVPVWRLVEKKFVLRGLPWCLSKTNEEGSCPAPAALPAAAFRAALREATETTSGGPTKFSLYSLAFTLLLVLTIEW